MHKHLHIVSFAVPYPVAHGGLFDLYYKLVALYNSGVKIHLHCFTEGSTRQQELDKYCESVHYYRRKTGISALSFSFPYIVSSRSSRQLKHTLLSDNYPILLEGIHCTHILNDTAFARRKIILRLHNVEHEYYRRLYIHSSSFLKKIYYLQESRSLKKYESRIANKPSLILAVSKKDSEIYRQQFGVNNIEFLPVFIGCNITDIIPGTGCFCLYHGNLSVAENEKAVLWLLEEVFTELNIPLIIAGRNPSKRLGKKIKKLNSVSLISNPSEAEMQDLLRKAQCHVLPSFNSTGVKLKLVNALYNGRHCIVNTAAVEGSGMEKLCHIADSAITFRENILSLFAQPLTQEDIFSRLDVLNQLFDNKKNADWLIRKLW